MLKECHSDSEAARLASVSPNINLIYSDKLMIKVERMVANVLGGLTDNHSLSLKG